MPSLTTPQREMVRGVVLELYLLNVRGVDDICRFLADKKQITLSRRQVERYLAETKKDLKTNAAIDREEMIGVNLARLEDLYRRCIKDEKHQTALGVIREISETFGLKAPAKLEHEAGESLHDWLSKAKETWPTEGAPDGSEPTGGPDPATIPEQNH